MCVVLCALLAACGSSSPDVKSQSQGTTAAETNAANSVSEMSAGDFYVIQFDAGNATVAFDGADSSAEYQLIIQTTTSASSSVTLASSNEAVDPVELFNESLRDREVELSQNAEPGFADLSVTKAVSKVVVGDTNTFRVLSSISSSTSYNEVEATVECVGDEHIALYVDNELPEDNLDSTDIETLCEQFEYAVATEIDLIGEPSNIDGDNRVAVLITPAVNRLGASGGGIITGFFYASDLYARSSISNPTSDEMEVVYILAPDPNGDYGTAITKEFAMSNLMPAVVPHEVQHLISYNQHVFVNSGGSEESWLNEAMSHFVEDLTGFGLENPSRVEMFLASPATTSLAPSSSPNLYQRGAGYLFIRYLYEQAADPTGFLAALIDTNLTGEDNLEAAFSGSNSNFDEWEDFMRRWAIAIALTNTDVSSSSEYQLADRFINSTTGNWQGICLICSAEDNRDTILTGPYSPELTSGNLFLNLSGTGTTFYTVSNPPSSLNIYGSTSASLQGVLVRTE